MSEWTIPCEPELLYLRDRVKRLEGELRNIKGPDGDRYSIKEPPRIINGPVLLPKIEIPMAAYCRFSEEPNGTEYHMEMRSINPLGIGHAYYISKPELLTAVYATGILEYLHKGVIFSIGAFLEKKLK